MSRAMNTAMKTMKTAMKTVKTAMKTAGFHENQHHNELYGGHHV